MVTLNPPSDMPSPRQMCIITLRQLVRERIREQMRLKMVIEARRAVQADEETVRARVAHIKAKIAHELEHNAKLLGVVSPEDEDDSGRGF